MFSVDQNQVWLLRGGGEPRERVCSVGEEMAVAYDVETGVAHRIGTRAVIDAWIGEVRHALLMAGAEDPCLRLVSFVANDASLAAALACWERSGSANTFAERFGQETGAAPAFRH